MGTIWICRERRETSLLGALVCLLYCVDGVYLTTLGSDHIQSAAQMSAVM